jgi:hypothetical protein
MTFEQAAAVPLGEQRLGVSLIVSRKLLCLGDNEKF